MESHYMYERRLDSRSHSGWIVGLLLGIIILIPFSQVWNHSFINYDDTQYITENPRVFSGLSVKNIIWAFSSGYASNWHPLTWLSHMLDCTLFGTDPRASHLINIFFHLVNALLLYSLFHSTTGSVWKSGLVAALFAVHPFHVESVAWAAERKDVLSTLFWLLTMICYVRYTRHGGTTRYLLVVWCFLLGLLAKPMLVTLPFVLLLLDFWPLQRIRLKVLFPSRVSGMQVHRTDSAQEATVAAPSVSLAWLIWEKLPLLALSVVSGTITFLVQQHGGAVETYEICPLGVRLANALVAYGIYIGKTLLPLHLALLYPHPQQVLWPETILSLLFLATASILSLQQAGRRPFVPVGWFWFLGTLIPVIGLIQVGSQAMADRYTYVPLIGIFILIAWGVPELAAGWKYRQAIFAVVASTILLVLLILTFRQVGYWKNSISIWSHTVAVTKNNFIALNNLGLAFIEQGHSDKAIHSYEKALQINPKYSDGYNNLGTALAAQQRLDEAIHQYRQALRIKPHRADTHSNLGVALAGQDRMNEATVHFLESLRLKPTAVETLCNYGYALETHGNIPEAILQYQAALRVNPDSQKVHNHLGLVWAGLGRIDQAVAHFKEVVRIDPRNAEVHNNWGTLLARNGNLEAAAEHYREALRIKPDFEPARKNLERVLNSLSPRK